jgi:hypothetical protein
VTWYFDFQPAGGMSNAENFIMQFAGHRLTLLATDGMEVQPIHVAAVNVHLGERYDVVLCADQVCVCVWGDWVSHSVTLGQQRSLIRLGLMKELKPLGSVESLLFGFRQECSADWGSWGRIRGTMSSRRRTITPATSRLATSSR